MTLRRKVLTAGAILALGVVLAWPFRKAGPDTSPPTTAPLPAVDTLRAQNGDPIAAIESVRPSAGLLAAPVQVTAKMASTNSTGDIPGPPKLGGFDLANHPALAGTTAGDTSSSAVPIEVSATPKTQPAYDTTGVGSHYVADEWPAELVHVVANGDTLEKLAERYLNDAGRALEIFDLNRDQLSNPHLLPIGVELRVPRNPDRIVD